MDILLLIYNLVLQILYCIPIVYALIFYQHTKRVLYLYVTGLFFSFSIENILICITEFNSEFAEFYDTTFMTVPTSRTIIFVAVLLFMLMTTASILKEKPNSILLSLLGIVILFMLFVPMLNDSAMKVFIYYTPCQIFSFILALYGMNRLNTCQEYYQELIAANFQRFFLWTAVFSILIILEDWIVIFHFDNYGNPGLHIMNRSFTENLMSIYFIFAALRIFVPHLRHMLLPADTVILSEPDQQTKPTDTPKAEISSEVHTASLDTVSAHLADYSKLYLFSRDHQLTPREQHILILLLENKTNAEIGNDLCISTGTAKAHVHNIFAKVDVKKRQQLLDVYDHYISSEVPPK